MTDKITIEVEFLAYTRRAGEISRQLGLAGIAVIWLFTMKQSEVSAAFSLASGLKCPLLLIITSLGIDAFQYVVGSVWLGFHWFLKKGSEDMDSQRIAAGVICFMIIVKLSIMAFAYYELFIIVQSSILWK